MVLLCGCRKSYYIVAVAIILAIGQLLSTEGFAPSKQHPVAPNRIPKVRNDEVFLRTSRLFAVLPLPPAAVAVDAPFTTSTLVTAAVTTTTTATTAPASPATKTTSNLPSQKELLSKASAAPATTTASTAASSSSSSTGTGIIISNIEYDGKVPKVESDEYVVLTNQNKAPMDISGYYIYVATTGTQGPTFVFPSGTILKPNQSIRVYTNEIHKESGGYSFESGKAIWNNNGGIAVLKDSSNKKIMEYKYKAPK